MKYHRVEERHFLIYERGLIWEGRTSCGALISVADNMLIMICGDGDFRVNLRKRHRVDPRWEFRVFESADGEKYRGILHAESKWIVNHRRAMPIRVSRASADSRPNFAHVIIYFSRPSTHLFESSPLFLPFMHPKFLFHCLVFLCIFSLKLKRSVTPEHLFWYLKIYLKVSVQF